MLEGSGTADSGSFMGELDQREKYKSDKVTLHIYLSDVLFVMGWEQEGDLKSSVL